MSFNYKLPKGWNWKTIQEVHASDKGATITGPFGSSIGKRFFVEQGIPVIRGNNLSLKALTFIDEDFVFVSAEKAEELKRYYSVKDDLLFTAAGTIGQVGIIPKDSKYEKYIISNKQLRARFNRKLVDPMYAYYWFSSKPMVEYIKRQNTGSTIPLINLSILRSLPIPLPDLSTQIKIRKILELLDKKITNNTQTNQTLEAMAQAIFKSWFVDFDPVHHKMHHKAQTAINDVQNANTSAYPLPQAVLDLFPDNLVESELGLIPEGWESKSLADISHLNKTSWTKKNHPTVVNYVDLANTKNGIIESISSFDFEDSPSRARRVINENDTIIGTVRPGNRSFAYIGKTEQQLTASTGFVVLTPVEKCWASYIYLCATQDETIEEYARLADGGAYPAIKPNVVSDTKCVLPTKKIIEEFWRQTSSLLEMCQLNKVENIELANLRDTLLPKLLSGEIDLAEPLRGVTEIKERQTEEQVA